MPHEAAAMCSGVGPVAVQLRPSGVKRISNEAAMSPDGVILYVEGGA
jgi:hypothetical protein